MRAQRSVGRSLLLRQGSHAYADRVGQSRVHGWTAGQSRTRLRRGVRTTIHTSPQSTGLCTGWRDGHRHPLPNARTGPGISRVHTGRRWRCGRMVATLGVRLPDLGPSSHLLQPALLQPARTFTRTPIASRHRTSPQARTLMVAAVRTGAGLGRLSGE